MLATGGGVIAVFALIFINGFFVAAEFAFIAIRRTRVEQLVAAGRPGAGSVQDAINHLDSYIAACQLGITIASIALGWVAEPLLAGLVDPALGAVGAHGLSTALIFLVITALHVVSGEQAPKMMALQYPERMALITATPVRVVRATLRPAIAVLTAATWAVARAMGVSADVGEQQHPSPDELRLVVRASGDAGALEREQQFLLERVLRFGTLTVESVMLPRTELRALPVETSTADAVRFVGEHHHSRYPVYRDSLDNVVGVLHVRDLLLAKPGKSLGPLLRQPLMVPTQASVTEVLEEMRERKTHFAIAVDEYGGTDGIVTLEDVLEEIVGELQDEFEEPQPAYEERPGGVIRMDGLDSVDVLAELLGVDVEDGPYNTVAGYVVDRIGHIPRVGDSADVGGYRLTVVELDDLRAAVVEATPLELPPEPSGDAEPGGDPDSADTT